MREVPSPGDVVGGKYRLKRVLGRGGMGSVFQARHEITGRRVALKWLVADTRATRARLEREAQALGALAHPNVVQILDVGEHEGAVFLVMEFVEGANLRDFAKGREIGLEEAVRLLMPALSGLAAAHRAGLLHRDLKPDNLLVCCERDGTAYDTKVLDFGVAKRLTDVENDDQVPLTRSGTIVGTPRYMAPEQLDDEELSERSDIYSLGVILYEVLAGKLPYRSSKLRAVLVEILIGQITPIGELRPELPTEFAAVLERALAREPKDRFESVAEFARALEPFGGGATFAEPRDVHTTPHSLDTVAPPPSGDDVEPPIHDRSTESEFLVVPTKLQVGNRGNIALAVTAALAVAGALVAASLTPTRADAPAETVPAAETAPAPVVTAPEPAIAESEPEPDEPVVEASPAPAVPPPTEESRRPRHVRRERVRETVAVEATESAAAEEGTRGVTIRAGTISPDEF